jgi:hypothetical protein
MVAKARGVARARAKGHVLRVRPLDETVILSQNMSNLF